MLDTLLYTLGVLVIALGIIVSIALHELGHFIPAKLFGVKVTQFMVGFGKTVWSIRRGETEYGVKALPLGGYVAMSGMLPPAKKDGAPRESSTGFFDSLAHEAEPSSRVADTDTESARTFYALPVYKKIIIMAAGPFVNLILGFVFFAVLISGIGVQAPSLTVGSVSECLKTVTAQQQCEVTDPPAPAAAAALLPGDKLLAINGVELESWQHVRQIIADNPGAQLRLSYLRQGQEYHTTLAPQLAERTVYDDKGAPVLQSDGSAVTEKVGTAGIASALVRERQPLTQVPKYVGEQISAVSHMILRLPQRMVDIWHAAFSKADRDPNGPISVVGVGRLAGEITALEQTPMLDKISALTGLLAGLNIALFVFNLIPLLPLDGGHIAGALYEGAKRRIFRFCGKADPGPIDITKFTPVTYTVVLLLGAMSLLLMYADIVKPVTLGG